MLAELEKVKEISLLNRTLLIFKQPGEAGSPSWSDEQRAFGSFAETQWLHH